MKKLIGFILTIIHLVFGILFLIFLTAIKEMDKDGKLFFGIMLPLYVVLGLYQKFKENKISLTVKIITGLCLISLLDSYIIFSEAAYLLLLSLWILLVMIFNKKNETRKNYK